MFQQIAQQAAEQFSKEQSKQIAELYQPQVDLIVQSLQEAIDKIPQHVEFAVYTYLSDNEVKLCKCNCKSEKCK